MKRLHILKKTSNPEAERLMAFQADKGETVEVLLIQDAVFTKKCFGGFTVIACKEDVEARNVEHHKATLDYGEMVQKIMAADTVTCW